MEHFERLGAYRVERRLGEGAFASVWLAHDELLQSPVAVKVLAVNWAQDDAVREQFLEEARLLRRLDDDHVVRVYSLGQLDDGRPFFAMEWADGGTLGDRLVTRDGPLGVDEAISVAIGVLAGLAAVHSIGLVHRDVKPSNVLFKSLRSLGRPESESKRVLLGDLGLANTPAKATGGMATRATPAYMAPEQVSLTGVVDPRTDLYAVAAVLYEMLADRRTRIPWSPSGGESRNPAVGLSRPTEVAIPDRVWGVIERGLALDPADRFTDAEEMASVLAGSDKPSLPRSLPTGTLTLLFSDIEGSTRLWERSPDAMAGALERHDALMRSVIESAGGYVFKTVGDAFCAAFAAARDAVGAAAAAQTELHSEAWSEGLSLRVRMALHTGECEERDGDYFGPAVNRTARLEATAHGGQIVISRSTAEVVRDRLPPGMTLLDLGPHRLRDLDRPEDVFQLSVDGVPSEFPPLRSQADAEIAAVRPAKQGRSRRSKRGAIAAGVGTLVLVVALATFAVTRSDGGDLASTGPTGVAVTSAPGPLLVADDLGPGWAGGGPLPVPASLNIPTLFSCSAVTAPKPEKPIFHEEGDYYPPNSTNTFVQEDVYQFRTGSEADGASSWLEQVVSRCGLPSLDAYGNILGRESPAAVVGTPHQFCKSTTTFGLASAPGLSEYDDGAVCASTLIALRLEESAGSHLGISDLSGYLGGAVSRVLAALATSPRLPAPPTTPSTDVLQDELLTPTDLGPSWRPDNILEPPQLTPYDCGGPGIPAPIPAQSAVRAATVGYSDGSGTVIQQLTYFAHLSDASQWIEDNEAVNRLCTFPAGEEAAQHWAIDRSAPRACAQSFVARPTGPEDSSGAYKFFVRCGNAISSVWVTPGPNGISETPSTSTLIRLVTDNTEIASH